MGSKPRFDHEIYRRSMAVIHHGALTNSKRPDCHIRGIYPSHVTKGLGCYLWDTSGNKYVDYICGLGTNLFGYANGRIAKVVTDQLSRGSIYSLSSVLEVQVAEKLKGLLHFCDKFRFMKTGTEACNSAIRIARAHHGVCYENEEMYKVFGNKDFTRIPQQKEESGWLGYSMQNMHQRIQQSILANGAWKNHEIFGEQKISKDGKGNGETFRVSKEEEENPPWDRAFDKIQRYIKQEEEKHGNGQDIQNGFEILDKETMRDMWESEFTGSSRRLFETPRSSMALPKTSHGKTPRVLILTEGYHGHGDAFISVMRPRIGVVNDPYILPLSGNEDLIPISAGVIVEPVMTDYSNKRIEYLKHLRDECTKHNTLLIFDEIITGFRYKNLTFSNDTGLYPDIILLGKAIGGGLPLSVIGTRPGIGEDKEWFVSGTFCGDTLALAAFNEVMNMVHNDFKIDDLWVHGQKFIDGFNSIDKDIQIKGYPTRGVFVGDEKKRHLFFQEACRANLLFGPSFFYNFNHIDLNDLVLNSCKDIIMNINTQKVELDGLPPVSPFSAKARE